VLPFKTQKKPRAIGNLIHRMRVFADLCKVKCFLMLTEGKLGLVLKGVPIINDGWWKIILLSSVVIW
jgi:hypothetical protein